MCRRIVRTSSGDRDQPSVDTPFLLAPNDTADLEDEVEIAIGNTTSKRSRRWSSGSCRRPTATRLLASYEALLDALQLGLLRDLEAAGNTLVTLEEALHARAFSQIDGGHLWTVQQGRARQPGARVGS